MFIICYYNKLNMFNIRSEKLYTYNNIYIIIEMI